MSGGADTRVELGLPAPGRAWATRLLAAAWLLLCVAMIARLFLTTATPSLSSFGMVALWSMFATPAAILLLAVWRERQHPTTVERVGDQIVVTSPAFLTAPLVIPVGDVVEVRYGAAGPPGETKEWPALSSGVEPTVGLVLGRETALPAREPAPWTGEEMPRRHRLAHAVLLTAADPPSAAAAIAALAGLRPVHVPGRPARQR